MKLALIIQGGGTRGAYAAGVTDVLLEHGILADGVYGTSAGSLTGVNYVSQEPGRAAKLFLTLMGDPHFVRHLNLLTKGSMFDFSEMFFEVPKGKIPFNSALFFSSKTEFHCCATSCESGKPVYFSKLDPEFYSGLAASASLPLATKPTLVHGHPYLDGGVVDPAPLQKAFDDGYDKAIVVLTREKGYRKKKPSSLRKHMAKMMYRKHKAFLKAYNQSDAIYNDEMDFIDRMGAEGQAFVIYPSKAPEVGHAEKDTAKIAALITEGRQDALDALEKLEEYLSK